MFKYKFIVIMFCCFFVATSFIYGQDGIVGAVKSDNIGRLSNLLTIEQIDECIEIDGANYNYLAFALKSGSIKTLNFLLAAGADVNAVCTDKTPLMYAVKYGQLESIKTLLSAGANPNLNNGEQSLILYAKENNQTEIVNFLETTFLKQ